VSATATRPWRISSPDEKWTPLTWLLFLGLFLVYGVLILGVTGLWSYWFDAVRSGFGAIADCFTNPDVRVRGGSFLIGLLVFAMGTVFVSVFPLIIVLIPTLATLIGIMQHVNKKRS
jgi:hypothetical protein